MPSAFSTRLAERNPTAPPERWVYAPYDQLTDRIGPLASATRGSVGLILLESEGKGGRRPYHKQKLALILANQRHFALEQAAKGVPIRYEHASDGYAAHLQKLIEELGPIATMRPAEYELRHEIARIDGLEMLPHEGWLSTPEDFFAACGDPPWRMDAFYRIMRRKTGYLMRDGKPEGGKFSYDVENRKPWRGEPAAPQPPRFRPDDVTREVGALIEKKFTGHPGRLDLTTLPVTQRHARTLFKWAIEECLPQFGPYEDAMARQERTLFHTRLAPLLHLHRVLPRDLVEGIIDSDAPLASREGALRQVLGWREFVRHVHEHTDGLRNVKTNTLGANEPLPPAYWDKPSGLHCLDRVVESVWDEGYSHHITRLMVLSNVASLLDISPRDLTDWFWVAYTDAFDWVVEPNVLGMGTYGCGDLMITKPYVSGANYINKMSDYCSDCAFDPKKNCPLTNLYWDFLSRHEKKLTGNPRMRLPLNSLRKRSDEQREIDHDVFLQVRRTLRKGGRVTP